MEKWTVVYKTKNIYQAYIAKNVLEEKGIFSVIINKKDSAYLLDEGLIEILVSADDVIKAIRILEQINFQN